MSQANLAAVVFTFKSIENICSVGGTQSWRMHQSHFGTFDYVICARNRRRGGEGQEEHGAAFLIGKVRDIVPSTEHHDPDKPRFLIRMTEAAIITGKPNFWRWGRWPTHYESLDSLGIDPEDYEFKPLSEILANERKRAGVPSSSLSLAGSGVNGWKSTIDRAKTSLAAELVVDVDAISISVRV